MAVSGGHVGSSFGRSLCAMLLCLAQAAVRLPTEVSESACAWAREDCRRTGRRPLRAGGVLLPRSWDWSRRSRGDGDVDGGVPAVRGVVEALYEAAMVNASVELRPHLSTVVEYSQRSRSVLQLGDDGSSDAAWIAVLKGGLQREDGQLYQMQRQQLPLSLKSFQSQHWAELRELGITMVERPEGALASELLFVSSSWHLDWEDLAAQGAAAQVILLHGMQHRWAELEDWLQQHSAWQLSESSLLGAAVAVLTRRDDVAGEMASPRSNCSWSSWAETMQKASKLIQVQHDYPSLLGSTWHVKPDIVKSFRRSLAAIKSRCSDAKAALEVLKLFESEDLEELQGLIEHTFQNRNTPRSPGLSKKDNNGRFLKEFFNPSFHDSWQLKETLQHPEVALLILYRGQVSKKLKEEVLQRSIVQWPHRSEFWYLSAEDLLEKHAAGDVTEVEGVNFREGIEARALHAIRRSFSLSHFDRAMVQRLLHFLETLHRADEAALLWQAVAGGEADADGADGSNRLWDDPRRTALAAVLVPEAWEKWNFE